MKTLLTMSLALGLTSGAWAVIPRIDGFDSDLVGTTFTAALRDWQASTSAVKVVSGGATNSVQSVLVKNGSISNAVGVAAPPTVVWTEFHIRPLLGRLPANLPTNAATFACHFGLDSNLTIATSGGYQTITNDIFGNPVASIDPSAFTRLSIYQDFSRTNLAVLLNGVVVAQDKRFPGASLAYQSFEVQNPDGNAYLDEVKIAVAVPPSSNGNNDAYADAAELNSFGYVARTLKVGTGQAYTSLQTAIDTARERDTILVTNNTGFAETLMVDHNVTLAGMAFTNTGTLTVNAGVTLRVSGSAGATVASLALGAGSSLSVTNGTFATTTAGGLNLAGAFTIAAADWNDPQHKSPLPFADTFEDYGAGMPISNAWFRGWGASDAQATFINNPVVAGARAARVVGVVSNRINGAGVTRVWTDFHLRPLTGREPASTPTGANALFYINLDGRLAIYSNGTWEVATNAVLGGALDPLSTNAYARISVFTDFGTDKAAFFVNGVLARQLVDFPSGGASAYTLLALLNAEGVAFLDSVAIGELEPPGLDVLAGVTGDADGDGKLDADEIHLNGSILVKNHWTVDTLFHFR